MGGGDGGNSCGNSGGGSGRFQSSNKWGVPASKVNADGDAMDEAGKGSKVKN